MFKQKPVLNSRFKLIRSEDGCYGYLYDTKSESVKILDSTALRILELCNGNYTLDEIARIISLEYEIDLETVKQDLLAFMRRLIESDIIRLS